MKTRHVIVVAIAGLLTVGSVSADGGVPMWQRVLRWVSGDSSETPVPTAMMGKHMQMSVRQPDAPGDRERAEAILAAARRVLHTYRDVQVAEQEGYRPFLPRNVIGEEVHYTHYWRAGAEKDGIDLERPGSILYQRTPAGMKAVGVMYTAPAQALQGELDRRIPLSIGTWHRHVNFCGWPRGTPRQDFDGPHARFGFAGSIADEATCQQAGGFWIPLAFGWMTHVYPNESEPDKIWIGEHMMKVHLNEAAPAAHRH